MIYDNLSLALTFFRSLLGGPSKQSNFSQVFAPQINLMCTLGALCCKFSPLYTVCVFQ